MCAVVHSVSGVWAKDIFYNMPLKIVFAYEHYYYLKEGVKCRVLSHEESLEELVSNL
tara:strand:- start:462 stop:632 length:171 start_codon:yes stop_codon:yes gene_type:complete